jgi:small subunit ribosomal protein S9
MVDTTTKQQYYYGLGRRKTATAIVRLYSGGTGQIQINEKTLEEYFGTRAVFFKAIFAPLQLFNLTNQFDIHVKVTGGGTSAQTGAITHGISRALLIFNEEFKSSLRGNGFLTRDSRMKERKKPGLKRARKASQFTKR